ncbi:outer membrane beta-barrel protein [Polaribacter sp.]|uniref:outer membrane beta-barrel protein n=1 Tax=Polaribacter sp. TaxID=1920175 RepID=UPI003F6997F0
MKKFFLLICLAFAFSQTTNAQVSFGLKGGINYNSNSIENVSEDVFSGAKSKTGYHAGIWLRFKVPVIGLYIRPELIYTNLENSVTYNNTSSSYKFQKIDVPVLLGKKIFGVGNIFIGPSFQYVLDSDFGFDDISDIDTSGFTAGLTFGGGIELGKIGIDVRWERSFSGIESSFARTAATNVNFDTRVNQIIIGLSYRL